MSTDYAIESQGLSKRFGKAVAVDNVTFAVEAGEIFGFMGHNGAGKTTTLRMLLGLTLPTAGTARVLGHDIRGGGHEVFSVRQATGYLPASYTLPPHMTARQFLHYVGAMFSLPDDLPREEAARLSAEHAWAVG